MPTGIYKRKLRVKRKTIKCKVCKNKMIIKVNSLKKHCSTKCVNIAKSNRQSGQKHNKKWCNNISKSHLKNHPLEIEKEKLINELKKNNYNVSKTSRHFDISVSTIWRHIRRYKIKWNHKKTTSENNRGKIPWNKDLRKNTDKRVASYSKKLEKFIGEKHHHYGKKRKRSIVEKAAKSRLKTEKRKKRLGIKNKKVWNFGKTKETDKRVLQASQTKIKNIIKHHGQMNPWYNINACILFRKINRIYKLNGRHAENRREFFIGSLCYFLDFYSKKYNLVIEYNEEQHYVGNRLTKKHKNRQVEIKNHLRCKFINIRQKTFNEEKVLRKIELYIRDFNLNNISRVKVNDFKNLKI